MSKSLYEESLADIRKLKEIATENAKKAILDDVEPRIKELIERQLFEDHCEHGDDETCPKCEASACEGAYEEEDDDQEKSTKDDKENILVDESAEDDSAHISPPDEEGKVTLDIDSMVATNATHASGLPKGPTMQSDSESEEYELDEETVSLLKPIVESMSSSSIEDKLELEVYRLSNKINEFSSVNSKIRKSQGYLTEIRKIFSKLINTYKYVQENKGLKTKDLLTAKLEELYKKMKTIKEFTEMAKKSLNEEDLTIKVKGLPDGVDLDELDLDIMAGDEEAGEDLDLSGGDEMAGDEAGEEMEAPLPDEGEEMAGSEDEEEEDKMKEMDTLDDDTVVEIDEGMLRREIVRMKKLHEAKMGIKDAKANQFGGGKEEGDPLLDGDVTTGEDLAEGLEDEEDVDSEEKDEMVESRKVFVLKKQLAEKVSEADKFRKQLAEANLVNSKLLSFNKLLQNDNLTQKQKRIAMERINEARSLREVKLVYESLTKTLGSSKKLTESKEDQKVLGSSSKVTTKSSSGEPRVVNEAVARWAELAGLKG